MVMQRCGACYVIFSRVIGTEGHSRSFLAICPCAPLSERSGALQALHAGPSRMRLLERDLFPLSMGPLRALGVVSGVPAIGKKGYADFGVYGS